MSPHLRQQLLSSRSGGCLADVEADSTAPLCPSPCLLSRRIGQVVLMGTFGATDVTTSGISTVSISGVTDSVTVDLGGISDVFLEPASDSMRITGR